MVKNIIGALWSLVGATLAIGGCSGPVIPAHVLAATLVVNGTTSSATLSFPAHDASAKHHPGDSTCSLNAGHCSWDEPTVATVSGDAPIDAAWMATIGGGTFLAYTVTVRQPGSGDATCILDSSLGTVPCDHGQGSVMLTLKPQ